MYVRFTSSETKDSKVKMVFYPGDCEVVEVQRLFL